MKQKIQASPLRRRITIIGGIVVLSVLTALVIGYFDRVPADGIHEELTDLPAAPTEATLEAFRIGSEQMAAGDFAGAIRTYEEQLSRLNEIPIGNLSSYFGDLGLAHYYQGRQLQIDGQAQEAEEHFVRAAFMFEQAAETATHGVIASVAEYYRVLALFAAGHYEGARAAGETFLDMHPEVAIEAEFLPRHAVAAIKEILAVSYMTLAEESGIPEARVNVLRNNGLRYAEEAISESPEQVIQPYFFTGLEAHRRGERTKARERLRMYMELMDRIPKEQWSEEDRLSVAEAATILTLLQ